MRTDSPGDFILFSLSSFWTGLSTKATDFLIRTKILKNTHLIHSKCWRLLQCLMLIFIIFKIVKWVPSFPAQSLFSQETLTLSRPSRPQAAAWRQEVTSAPFPAPGLLPARSSQWGIAMAPKLPIRPGGRPELWPVRKCGATGHWKPPWPPWRKAAGKQTQEEGRDVENQNNERMREQAGRGSPRTLMFVHKILSDNGRVPGWGWLPTSLPRSHYLTPWCEELTPPCVLIMATPARDSQA